MVQLTPEQIETFQGLYRQHFGSEISLEEAREKGDRLVELIRLVRNPPRTQQTEDANTIEN